MPDKLTFYHTRPPHTLLGSTSALSSVELSDECLLQTSEIGHISEIHLCGAGSDVRDGFIQFSNYRLADYFALQFKVRAGDFGVTEVYDPENDGFFSVHGVVLGSSHLHGCVGARGAYHWHLAGT